MVTSFFTSDFFFLFFSDIRPDRTGELDHGDPLRLCRSFGSAAPQGGYSATVTNRDPQTGAEDWHGREDEKDGRYAAVNCHRYQEEEDHTGAGMEQGYCCPSSLKSSLLFCKFIILLCFMSMLCSNETRFNLVRVPLVDYSENTLWLLHTQISVTFSYTLKSWH